MIVIPLVRPMQTFFSVALSGISGYPVVVEVDVMTGMGQFTIVWLGDTAIQESRERVRSAIKNSGFSFPGWARITVNLAPADLRKKWPLYDLPIALGIIGKENVYQPEMLNHTMILGELALDGGLRGIVWGLPAAILAREQWKKYLMVPYENAKECALIPDIHIIPIKHLREAVNILTGASPIPEHIPTYPPKTDQIHVWVDFANIHGQEHAKRALTIAAAWWHNILMQWPPWSGKTMLAKALRGILPWLEIEEQIEISQIYSVAGLLSSDMPFITERPFRTIHHTASEASVIGWWRDAKPGEISLAHKGILFLDEFLEFSKNLLETLRQPLEDGYITVNRVNHSARYPSRFSLVGAMNPCPCGFLWDPDKACTCAPHAIERYRSRLSGPILDRIDMFLTVPRIKVWEIDNSSTHSTNKSIDVRQIVSQARIKQNERFHGMSIFSNAEMSNKDISTYGMIDPKAKELAITSVERLNLSTRAYYRILRLARTIADIEWSDFVHPPHILEALSYRGNTH